MARKLKILIVDDSMVVRRLVREMLLSDPDIGETDSAPNGKVALMKLSQSLPDAVILDVAMPVMDGLEALAEIRKQNKSLPVIMFSTLTRRAAAATLDALALGANDYLPKPSNEGGATTALGIVRQELLRKVKLHCLGPAHLEAPPSTSRAGTFHLPKPPPLSVIPSRPGALDHARHRVDVVVIGVSTGGPNALAEVLPSLPAEIAVPILVVQHMPPVFTSLLAERLTAKSRLKVREPVAGEVLAPGAVWLAPGDYHMLVRTAGTQVQIQTNQDPPENFCRPAVDVLFRSAATVYGPGVLAVVMTGMGHDGLAGCERVRNCHGQIIVQDEASSVVWGMPGFVARAGLADRIVPLAEIGTEIMTRVSKRPAPVRNAAAAGEHP